MATTVVAEEVLTIDVGGKTVIMPSPTRLVSINHDPGLMKDFQDYVDPAATLLAGFVTKWDMKRRNKGEELNYDMYGEAVVAKATLDVDVNISSLAKVFNIISSCSNIEYSALIAKTYEEQLQSE